MKIEISDVLFEGGHPEVESISEKLLEELMNHSEFQKQLVQKLIHYYK